MNAGMTEREKKHRTEFQGFVQREILPHAEKWDREQCLPRDIMQKCAAKGYFGAILPDEYGGQNMNAVTYGLLNKELGKACASVRSLVMIQNMIGLAIQRWGTSRQKQHWLPQIASGQTIAAFALTEPDIGSDASHIETSAVPMGDEYRLNGHKHWISLGQIADVFLLFARVEDQPCAFLIQKDAPGLSIEPIHGMMGLRASMLAQVKLKECVVPGDSVIGSPGFGFSAVALTALDLGRYSVAWGCTGLAQACLDACLRHSQSRKQFGVPLQDHQLIKQMITNMVVNIRAMHLLCLHAGRKRESGDPDAIRESLIAKYFASIHAKKIADDAVQIHGALGCHESHGVQRHLRDARIMEIIEGSTQILQSKIADLSYSHAMSDD